MTESEAIEVICREAGEEEGFVAEVERTGRILHERIALFYAALETLAPLWRGESEVPKRAIRPLVDLSSRIYAAAVTHESVYDEIQELSVEVYTRIARVFDEPPDPRTEDGARRIIERQFTSTAGLPYLLSMRWRYDTNSIDEALTALRTLGQAWRDRNLVPKTLAGVMFDIRLAVLMSMGPDPQQQAEIEALGATLNAAVLECLS